MAFINGIPLNWDDVEDNGLLEDLFGGTAPLNNPTNQFIGNNANVPSVFDGSPLGKNWETLQIIADDSPPDPPPPNPPPIPPTPNMWIYHVETDHDGLKLLQQYKYDRVITYQPGSQYDYDVDLSLYYELDDKYNDIGTICRVKMTDQIAETFLGYKTGEGWIKIFVDAIIKTEAKKGIVLNRKKILDAIDLELSTNPGFLGLLARIASFLLKELAKILRSFELSENKWNPNLKDYDPLLSTKLMDNMVKGWNSFKKSADAFFKNATNAGKWCAKYLSLPGELIKEVIDALVSIFKAIVDAVDFIMQLIAEVVHILKLVNAFICGVLNELINTAAAIVDLLALLVTLIDRNDSDELKEAFENFLEEYRKDPRKIIDQIKKGYDDLLARYSSDKNEYTIAYQVGQDAVTVIFWVEGIVAFVNAFRNLPKSFKRLKDWAEKKGKVKGIGKVLLPEYITLSKRIFELTKGKIAKQIIKDLEELYKAAEKANRELKTITEKFAKETKGTPGIRPETINKGLKSKDRALEKIEADYGGDASLLLDIAGSKVVFETVADVYKALEKFAKEFEILKFSDKIQKPFNGYRDITLNIKRQNGHIIEFKLTLREMDDAAQNVGHKLYEQQRTLEAISKKRKLTISEKKRIKKLADKQFELYNEAWNNIILKK